MYIQVRHAVSTLACHGPLPENPDSVLTAGPATRTKWTSHDCFLGRKHHQEYYKTQVLEVDVATEAGAKQLADAIAAKFGTVDYAVSAIGGWWQKGAPVCCPVITPSFNCTQRHKIDFAAWLARVGHDVTCGCAPV